MAEAQPLVTYTSYENSSLFYAHLRAVAAEKRMDFIQPVHGGIGKLVVAPEVLPQLEAEIGEMTHVHQGYISVKRNQPALSSEHIEALRQDESRLPLPSLADQVVTEGAALFYRHTMEYMTRFHKLYGGYYANLEVLVGPYVYRETNAHHIDNETLGTFTATTTLIGPTTIFSDAPFRENTPDEDGMLPGSLQPPFKQYERGEHAVHSMQHAPHAAPGPELQGAARLFMRLGMYRVSND